MPSDNTLWAFVATSLLVLLMPGPGVMYVVARSVEQGFRAGLVSVVGLSIGALVHVFAATVGLSALLLTSATAFTVVKYLGAGYLIYLGLRTLFAAASPTDTSKSMPASFYRLLVDGVIISVFNPKIAVFFLAFLPQFVNTDSGSITGQFLLLGLLYVGLALVTDGAYALLAGGLRPYLHQQIKLRSLPRYVSGCLYVGIGLSTALTDRRS